MKKAPVILLAALFFLLPAGCAAPEEEEEFDTSALVAIEEYIDELTMALIDTAPDLLGWVRTPYSDNLPLVYDSERIEWLEDHLTELEAIHSRRMGSGFPTEEEIAGWEVIVIRGGSERLLLGAEVLEILGRLEVLYGEVHEAIELIAVNEGELDLARSEQVMALAEGLEARAGEIREQTFN